MSLRVEGISKTFYPHPFWMGGSKRQGKVEALKDINLSLTPGKVMALIGENGSGKSTLLRILSGLLYPDKGLATLSNHHFPGEEKAWRCLTAYLDTESRSFYARLPVAFNLRLFATLNNHPFPEKLVEVFGISPLLPRRFFTLSVGQKQRVALVRTLGKPAELYCLDEPTRSLDTQGIQGLIQWLEEAKKAGKMVLLALCQEEGWLEHCTGKLYLREGRLH